MKQFVSGPVIVLLSMWSQAVITASVLCTYQVTRSIPCQFNKLTSAISPVPWIAGPRLYAFQSCFPELRQRRIMTKEIYPKTPSSEVYIVTRHPVGPGAQRVLAG